MNKLLLIASLIFSFVLTTSASIIVQSHWQMGEEAGDTDGRLDSVGGRDFNVNAGPVEFTSGVAPSTSGSTTAVNARALTGRAGFFGPNTTSFMPADNWGIEVWVRSANTTQTHDFFDLEAATLNGHLKIGQIGSNWAASYHNVAWLGADSGTGQPVTAEEWTHIAVVRDSGTSALYINGQAQAGTSVGTPVWGSSLHLGVAPGGASGWEGDFDDMRIFTFNPGEFDSTSDLLFAIPEPSTRMLILVGLIPLLALRRRRS